MSYKASSILYIVSGLFIFSSLLILLLDVLIRGNQTLLSSTDTFIELLEWNPFSQLSLIGFAHGLFLFWLALMTDKRNA